MSSKKKGASILRIIEKIAEKHSWKISLDPYRCAGFIEFSKWRRSFFWKNNFDFNPHGSVEFIEDKGYTRGFLSTQWYPVAPWYTCYFDPNTPINNHLEQWWKYATQIGYPIIIKPNSQSLGNGVKKINHPSYLEAAIREVLKYQPVFLIEKFVPGKIWRLLMSQDECVSYYQTSPARIIGDGKTNISLLIDSFIAQHPKIKVFDPRFTLKLEQSGYSIQDILPLWETLELLDISNFSAWGTMHFTEKPLHPEIESMMISLMHGLNLEWCGIDIICKDITKSPIEQDQFIILELNGKPGVSNIPEEQIYSTIEHLLMKLSQEK